LFPKSFRIYRFFSQINLWLFFITLALISISLISTDP
jgi:hypothetical protein